MTSTRVRHPILRLEVLAPDGTASAEHRVFCRLKRESVGVGVCCECAHCDAIVAEPAPSVECSIPVRPLEHADDLDGEVVEVGALLWRGTVVLGVPARIGQALHLLRTEDRRSVGVVDASGCLVGLIHESSFAGRSFGGRGGVQSMMLSSAVVVHESTPVRVALRLLAANHLREVTVVSTEGAPIGVFTDIDGLRWIAGTWAGGCA